MKNDCDHLAMICPQGRESCKTAIRIFLFMCVSKFPQGERPHYMLQEGDFRAVTGLCFLVWKCLTVNTLTQHILDKSAGQGPRGSMRGLWEWGGAGLCSKSLSLHEVPLDC